jgi:hypothetical protein
MKLNSNLYGISGSINSGKDLVGDMLMYIGENTVINPTYEGFERHEEYKTGKYSVKTISTYTIKKCADKLKEIVALLIGCKRSDLEDEVFKNKELGEEWWIYKRTYSIASFDKKTKIISKTEYDDGQEGDLYLGWEWDLVKLTPRLMLQLLGTQGGRMVIHPNIWVNALFASYHAYHMENNPFDSQSTSLPNWIITDIRFPENEGDAVTSRGGLLIGIKRHFALKQPKYAYLMSRTSRNQYEIPYELEMLDPKLYASLMHESEISMGDHSWCDVIIENNGTKEELFDQVLNAVTIKIEENV